MDRFSMHCEYCGYESIDPTDIRSVKELREKLTKIDERRFIWNPRRKSVLEGTLELVLKKDKDNELREVAMEEFQEQQLEDKRNVILNFAIPNSNKEILEFMLLAKSNVNTKDDDLSDLEEAWLSKMEEAYQRASILGLGGKTGNTFEIIFREKQQEVALWRNKKIEMGEYFS